MKTISLKRRIPAVLMAFVLAVCESSAVPVVAYGAVPGNAGTVITGNINEDAVSKAADVPDKTDGRTADSLVSDVIDGGSDDGTVSDETGEAEDIGEIPGGGMDDGIVSDEIGGGTDDGVVPDEIDGGTDDGTVPDETGVAEDIAEMPDEGVPEAEGYAYTEYDLWVGSTRVNSDNKDAIPGIKGTGAKAEYDPATHTLTFSGTVTGVTGTHNRPGDGLACSIYFYDKNYSLTIAGDADLKAGDSAYVLASDSGLVINNNINVVNTKRQGHAIGVRKGEETEILSADLTVKGSLSAKSKETAVYVEDTFSLNGTSITATSDIDYSINCGKLSVESGMITAKGSPAVAINSMTNEDIDRFEDNVLITKPANGKIIGNKAVLSIGVEHNEPASEVVMKKVTKYDLWVGSTRVHSDNKDNIEGVKGGTASYEPTTNTLTFNGSVTGVTGTHEISAGGYYYKRPQIYCMIKDTPLTIEGDAILHNENVKNGVGLLCDYGLTIKGNLDICSDESAIDVYQNPLVIEGSVNAVVTDGYADAVSSSKGIKVNGGTLCAKADRIGIYCFQGAIEVISGTLDSEVKFLDSLGNRGPIVVDQDSDCLVLSDDVEMIEPQGGINKKFNGYWNMFEADGETKAKRVRIVTTHSLLTVRFESKYTISIPAQRLEKGQKAVRPEDPVSDSGIFVDWYAQDPEENENAQKFDFDTPITRDTVIYAKWRNPRSFRVDYDLNGHGDDWAGFGSDKQRFINVREGGKAIDPGAGDNEYRNPTDTEWQFDGWYMEPECSRLYDFNTILKDDITLYAGWVETTVERKTVTFDLGEMTGKIPAIPSQKVAVGGTATEPAKPMPPARSLRTFEAWFSDPKCKDRFDFSTPITKDITLHAGWMDVDGFSVYFASDSSDEDALEWNAQKNRFEHVFTGSALRPEVVVTDVYGEELKEGVDYTIKYSNNKNVNKKGKPAVVTVKGKGNFRKSKKLYFYITPKALVRDGVLAAGIDLELTAEGKVIAVNNKVPAPVIFYDKEYNTDDARDHKAEYREGYKLTSKDYTLKLGNGKKKFSTSDKEDQLWIKITGRGNFTGSTVEIPVEVRSAKQSKSVALNIKIVKGTKFTYNGSRSVLSPEQMTVTGIGGAKLTENVDYSVSYSNNINAGTARVTVTGIGNGYQGLSASKTFKILPDKNSSTVTATVLTPVYDIVYARTGTKPEIGVEAERDGDKIPLKEGRDYKVTYSKNKKVGSKAKYKVSFMGNYKGRKAITGKFTINPARFGDGIIAVGVDKIYTKPGKYTSKIYVIDTNNNNRVLSSSDYSIVSYVAGDKNITKDKKYKPSSDLEYVKVTIRGKGNYTNWEKTFDKVYRIINAKGAGNLSKAKIVAKGSKKAIGTRDYSGKEVRPEIDVYFKNKKKWTKVDPGTYDVSYYNNVDKGKALVIVRSKDGAAGFAGCKTAVYKIGKKGLSGFIQRIIHTL